MALVEGYFLNWEKEGLIIPLRLPKGRRRYKKEDIEKLLGMIEEKPNQPLFCMQNSPLKSKKRTLKTKSEDLRNTQSLKAGSIEVISEIASKVK